MKINPHHPLTRTGPAERHDAERTQGASSPRQPDTAPSAMTHLSRGTADASQDIDTLRVEALKEAIREGRLDIQAERIADGLIASARELLDDADRQA